MRLLIFPGREGIALRFSRNEKRIIISHAKVNFYAPRNHCSSMVFLWFSILSKLDRCCREFSAFKKLAVIAASLLLEDARKVIECIFGKNLEFQEFLF